MILSDDEGQIAIDFLFGLAFFLIALMFTIQFVPALFTSASYSQEELGFVSHRTGSILTEDPGWWSNATHKGTDWELHPNSTVRVGLAEDDNSLSRLTDTPNLLNRSKVIRMMELQEGDLITMLGLYENINGARVNYSYNITLSKDDQPLSIRNQTICFGKDIPIDNNILQTRRIVMVAPIVAADFNSSQITASSADTLVMNITGPIEENVTIQITDFNITGANTGITSLKLDGTPLLNPENYTTYIKVNGNSSYITYNSSTDIFNSSDTLRFVIGQDSVNLSQVYNLEIEFDNVTFSSGGLPYTEYTNYTKPIYEIADLVVSVWK